MQKALKRIHVFAYERAGFKLASYRPLIRWLCRPIYILASLEFVYCLVLTRLATFWTSYEALRLLAFVLSTIALMLLQASYPIYLIN